MRAAPAPHPFRVTVQDAMVPKLFSPATCQQNDRSPEEAQAGTAATTRALSPSTFRGAALLGTLPLASPGRHFPPVMSDNPAARCGAEQSPAG